MKDGSFSETLLYRAPELLRPLRADGKRRLLSWSFCATFGGVTLGLEKQRRIEGHLRAVKAKADRKGSKLYMPTVAEAVDDYLDDPDTKAMRSIADRRRHMRVLCRHAGTMLVAAITHAELREVMAAELARGQSFESLRRLKAALSAFFTWLLRRDKVDSVEFMKKVVVPSSAPRDRRQRTLLTDGEQWTLFECEVIPLRYRLLYLLARLVGGMRASDLHALTWGMVDTERWEWCDVSRPKTDRIDDEPVRQKLEPEAAGLLKQWFLACGRPGRDKPVFARQRGGKLDKGAKGTRMSYSGPSYARRLRKHLKLAGIMRPELHQDVPAGKGGRGGSRRCDFHSFRRIYNTGLAVAGVNVQQAMALAGHRSAQTHMRYVKLAKMVMAAPEASRPQRPRKQDADTADESS